MCHQSACRSLLAKLVLGSVVWMLLRCFVRRDVSLVCETSLVCDTKCVPCCVRERGCAAICAALCCVEGQGLCVWAEPTYRFTSLAASSQRQTPRPSLPTNHQHAPHNACCLFYSWNLAASSEPPVALPSLYEWAPVPANLPPVTIWYSLRISLDAKKSSRISRTPAA